MNHNYIQEVIYCLHMYTQHLVLQMKNVIDTSRSFCFYTLLSYQICVHLSSLLTIPTLAGLITLLFKV